MDARRYRLSPVGFTAHIPRNAFTERWHGRDDVLERKVAVEGPRYRQAFEQGDPDHTAVWFGEACRMIGAIEPAAAIVKCITADAVRRLQRGGRHAAGLTRQITPDCNRCKSGPSP